MGYDLSEGKEMGDCSECGEYGRLYRVGDLMGYFCSECSGIEEEGKVEGEK